MTDKRNQKDKISKEKFLYNILGDSLMSESIDMDSTLDNSLQNLIISMEGDKIQKEIENKGKK